jgi:hypothetical protein
MRASGFVFMWVGLPQQRVWFDWSKVFQVHASVCATIRVHHIYIYIYHATRVHREARVCVYIVSIPMERDMLLLFDREQLRFLKKIT